MEYTDKVKWSTMDLGVRNDIIKIRNNIKKGLDLAYSLEDFLNYECITLGNAINEMQKGNYKTAEKILYTNEYEFIICGKEINKDNCSCYRCEY